MSKPNMIKRADGSYSQRGLWDNIRANRGSGKKPTKQMLEQEAKIKAQHAEGGYITNDLSLDEYGNGGYVVKRSSERKGKTHVVIGPDGTKKYFGDSKLGQHPNDPARKKAFYARHKHNLANNPYFRAFARKTWAEGGEIDEEFDQFADGGKTGMMKARMALDAHFGNPAAKRMVSANPKTGMTPEGIGTHYMTSMGNYAVPLLQDFGDANLRLVDGMTPSKEDMRFESPEDAEYFAQHYKEIAPMMKNFKEYKYGGIHIKPENKGKFNATKKATGKTTEELTHSKNPVTKKRAIFAQNAAKWKHAEGGEIEKLGTDNTNVNVPKRDLTISRFKTGSRNYNEIPEAFRNLPLQTGKVDDASLDAVQVLTGIGGLARAGKIGYGAYQLAKPNIINLSKTYRPTYSNALRQAGQALLPFAKGGRVLPKYADAGWLTKNKSGVGAGLGFAGDTTNLLFDNNVFGTRNEVTDSEGNVLGEAQSDAGSQTQGALSGALKGASAGAALGPWGMAGGALIGGVAGFLTADTGAEDKLNQIKKERNAQISFKNMLGKGPIENNSIQTNSLALSAYGGYINKKYAEGGMKTLNQNHPEATEEVELGESAMLPNGMNLAFGGETHENGGLETNLPEGTRIFSDRIKSGKRTIASIAKPIQNKIEKLKDNNSKAGQNTIKLFENQLDNLFNEQEEIKQQQDMAQQRKYFAKGGLIKYDGGGNVTMYDEKLPKPGTSEYDELGFENFKNIINSETGKNYNTEEIISMIQNPNSGYILDPHNVRNSFTPNRLQSTNLLNPKYFDINYEKHLRNIKEDGEDRDYGDKLTKSLSKDEFKNYLQSKEIENNTWQQNQIEDYITKFKTIQNKFPQYGNNKQIKQDAVINYAKNKQLEKEQVNNELGAQLDAENGNIVNPYNQNISTIQPKSISNLKVNNTFNQPNNINSSNFKTKTINPLMTATDYQPGSYGFATDPVLNLNQPVIKPNYVPSNSDQADYEYLKANPDIMKRGNIQPRPLSTLSPLDVKGTKMISPINNGKPFDLNQVKSNIAAEANLNKTPPPSEPRFNKGDIGTAGALGTSLLGNLIQRSNLNKVAPPRTLVAPTFTAGKTPVKADYSADLQSADNQFNAARRGVMMNSGNYSTQAGNLGQLRAEQLRNRSKILQNQNNANAVLMNEYQKAQADAINKNALSNYTTDQSNMENLYNYNLWKTGQTNAADASAFNTSGQMFNNMVTGQNQLDAAEMYRRMYAQKVQDDLAFKKAMGGTVRNYFAKGGTVYSQKLQEQINQPTINNAAAMDAEYASYLDAKGQPLQDTFKSKVTGLEYKVLPRKEKDLYAAKLWEETHGSAPTKSQVAATTKALDGKKTSSPGAKTVAQMMSDKFSVSDQEASLVNAVNADREDTMSYLPKKEKTPTYKGSELKRQGAQLLDAVGSLGFTAIGNPLYSLTGTDLGFGHTDLSDEAVDKRLKNPNEYMNAASNAMIGIMGGKALSKLGGYMLPKASKIINAAARTEELAATKLSDKAFKSSRTKFSNKQSKNWVENGGRQRKLDMESTPEFLNKKRNSILEQEDEAFIQSKNNKMLEQKLKISEGADRYPKRSLKKMNKNLDNQEIPTAKEIENLERYSKNNKKLEDKLNFAENELDNTVIKAKEKKSNIAIKSLETRMKNAKKAGDVDKFNSLKSKYLKLMEMEQ